MNLRKKGLFTSTSHRADKGKTRRKEVTSTPDTYIRQKSEDNITYVKFKFGQVAQQLGYIHRCKNENVVFHVIIIIIINVVAINNYAKNKIKYTRYHPKDICDYNSVMCPSATNGDVNLLETNLVGEQFDNEGDVNRPNDNGRAIRQHQQY